MRSLDDLSHSGQPGKHEEEGGGCPFCGAEDGGLLNFGCGTYAITIPLYDKECEWIRHEDCYLRQIAQLQGLLGECWEFFYAYENNLPIPFNTWPSEMLKKIQEFKPKEKP